MDRLKKGDIIKHFKYETLTDEQKINRIYTYEILEMNVIHSESRELYVVYKALYADEKMGVNYNIYIRPQEMFFSEVDHVKYPNIKQKYRFEIF